MSDAALQLGLFVLTAATDAARHSCRAAVVPQNVLSNIRSQLQHLKKKRGFARSVSRLPPKKPAFHQLASRNLGAPQTGLRQAADLSDDALARRVKARTKAPLLVTTDA